MQKSKNQTSCTNFKPADIGSSTSLKKRTTDNCKDCVYFSSRNCGMEVSDSIEPDLNLFY